MLPVVVGSDPSIVMLGAAHYGVAVLNKMMRVGIADSVT